MPKTPKDSTSENGKSEEKDEEVVEYDEDYSPKRGLTFIFVAAGFSLFLLAALAALAPYLIPIITGSYSQFIPYGYYYILDLIYGIATTCVAVLVAVVLYFSWSGEKKLFPDSLLIGLSVSIFSVFIRLTNYTPYEFVYIKYYVPFYIPFQIEFIQIGYAFNWVGILVLLALGTLSGFLGFKLSK
ncbi:MAG: hypothetical protein WED07_06165 [Candidatus Freyarchaeum deiterrae]